MPTTSNLPILLFLVPFIAALFAAIFGWSVRGLARWIALASLAATAALAVYATAEVLRHDSLHTHMGGWTPPLGIELVLDRFSAFVAIVIALVSFIALAGSGGSMAAELRGRHTSFYSSALLLVAGLMGMTVAADMFNLFVHLEVASLSAYALVAAGGRGAPRAALHYLIIGTLGASFYLLGVGFLYAATGSLNMADLAARLPDAEPRLAFVAGVFIIIGLGVKMALFPLHGWMPAAYSRCPSAAAALMAPLVTKVSAYALIRVMFWVYGVEYLHDERIMLGMLKWLGAAAMVVGGVMALLQSDLWRLLAYSSISQMGLVALGAGLANTAGLTGAILHIANDALMKGALFLAAGIALVRFGVRRVDDLPKLRGRSPWAAAVILVCGLSLVGLPPLCGFFSKWYVLVGAVTQDAWVVAAAVFVASLASAAYVFRIVEKLYFTPAEAPETEPATEGPAGMLTAALVLTLGVILLGLANERVVSVLIIPALAGGPG